ncbi:MAG: zinc ribbon domain-containing protein [Rhodobacteraceae bacterium]|nr:zinc ribbon domain-containing protein [Paracoccaceae bacterium]
MPVYEYDCPQCGTFVAFAPMAAFADPCDCPDCATSAPRALHTAPGIAQMSSTRRTAFATNERAADSPKRSGGGHGPGCGCCSGSKKMPSGTLHRPDGSKSFPAKRPWMISH